jgi:hypothetical protein
MTQTGSEEFDKNLKLKPSVDGKKRVKLRMARRKFLFLYLFSDFSKNNIHSMNKGFEIIRLC